MRLALVVVLFVPASAHAGKYMMGEPPSTGWNWVGDAIDDAMDVGPEAGIAAVVDTNGRPDLAFDATLRAGIYRPTKSWFASAGIELNVSFTFPVAWDWWQVRSGVGTAVGPVSLALSWVIDAVESGSSAGISPEVRIRHRIGDGLDKPSFGFFARMTHVFEARDQHPDRFAFGMFGAFDVL